MTGFQSSMPRRAAFSGLEAPAVAPLSAALRPQPLRRTMASTVALSRCPSACGPVKPDKIR